MFPLKHPEKYPLSKWRLDLAVQKADSGHRMRVIIKQVLFLKDYFKIRIKEGLNQKKITKNMFKNVDCEQHWKCSREVI